MLTVLAFFAHQALHIEPATVALTGAAVALLITRVSLEQALSKIEWPTLFFFVGLFMLVEGIVQVGIIGAIADGLFEVTAGSQGVTTIGLLWLSAIASAIIDNIPYTATAIPIVHQLAAGGLEIEPLWWALALGACLGGNATIIGASANVVVANLAAQAGHPITFRAFLPYGLVVVFESLLISTAYLWLRYLT